MLYVKKGDRRYVEGRPQYRNHQDGEGKDRAVAEIEADDVQLLSRRTNDPRGEFGA